MRVLILQGPVGGFFSYLARDLRARGHVVAKFNFNAGDLVYSLRYKAINYTGGQRGWRTWLRGFCANWKPEAIILFGDQRPIHRIAMHIARENNIAVYAFEEGYIRPNYVTFESGGNNANSPLLRNGNGFGAIEPLEEPPKLRPQFGAMTWRAIGYYMAMAFGNFLFPGYLHHRRRDLYSEAFLWSRSWFRLVRYGRQDTALVERLETHAAPPYFLLALQVHDDLQLLRHGKGWRNTTLIRAAVASFAEHAATTDILVIKVHPMDRGHRLYRRRVLKAARDNGVSERVHVLQSGPLASIVRAAKGLITINSSSGIVALEADVPVIALGRSIFSIEGLATGANGVQDLHDFWHSPTPPREKLAEKVVALLKRDHMLPGSFYLPETWKGICERVDARLRADEDTFPRTPG